MGLQRTLHAAGPRTRTWSRRSAPEPFLGKPSSKSLLGRITETLQVPAWKLSRNQGRSAPRELRDTKPRHQPSTPNLDTPPPRHQPSTPRFGRVTDIPRGSDISPLPPPVPLPRDRTVHLPLRFGTRGSGREKEGAEKLSPLVHTASIPHTRRCVSLRDASYSKCRPQRADEGRGWAELDEVLRGVDALCQGSETSRDWPRGAEIGRDEPRSSTRSATART